MGHVGGSIPSEGTLSRSWRNWTAQGFSRPRVAGSNPAERTSDRPGMPTSEENAQAIQELAASVRASNISLEALSGALMQFAVHNDERASELEQQVTRHRQLGKYNRRTHFWTMAMMVFGALFVADLAQHVASQWWDLLFWAHNHGRGGTSEHVLRSLGFLWQACYLGFLVKIAQVPEDLWPDIAAAQVHREKNARRKAKREKYFRIS